MGIHWAFTQNLDHKIFNSSWPVCCLKVFHILVISISFNRSGFLFGPAYDTEHIPKKTCHKHSHAKLKCICLRGERGWGHIGQHVFSHALSTYKSRLVKNKDKL